MDANENLVVEIAGHTNGNCDDVYCDQLSKDRRIQWPLILLKGIADQRIYAKDMANEDP